MDVFSKYKTNFNNQQLQCIKKTYGIDTIPAKLPCNAGDKISLKLVDGEIYVGKFYSQNQNNGRLSIFDVISLDTGQTNNCLCHFYPNEIREISLYETSTEAESTVQEVEKSENEDEIYENCKISNLELNRLKSMVKNYIMLNEVNEEFEKAINYLSLCDIVSIDGKNSEFGRNAKISLLVVCAWDQAYVFDVKLIGEKVFDSKLRDILQSKYVIKVVYNCKKLSECLIHQHNIHLQNIFDVNTAHFHINNENIEGITPNQKHLNDLFMYYFNIPINLIDTSSNIGKWLRRPLFDNLKKSVVENAVYLIPLYSEVDKIINQKNYACMRTYLDSLRTENAGNSHYLCTMNKLSDDFKLLMTNENS